MLTRIGGAGSFSVPGGWIGTGVKVEDEGGRISSPGWPGRWKRSVMDP